MLTRHVVTAIIAACVLGGCASRPMAPRAQEMSQVYETLTFKLTPKAPPSGKPLPCDRVTPGKVCEIDVSVTISGSMCSVNMREYVALGPLADVNRIEWVLPTGFQFCTRNGDGVFFDQPGSPPFDQDPTGPCKDKYGMKRNALDNADYGYFVRFRNKDSTLQCVKDPFYRNG